MHLIEQEPPDNQTYTNRNKIIFIFCPSPLKAKNCQVFTCPAIVRPALDIFHLFRRTPR